MPLVDVDPDAKQHRQRDPDRTPDQRFFHLDDMALAIENAQIDDEHRQHKSYETGPKPKLCHKVWKYRKSVGEAQDEMNGLANGICAEAVPEVQFSDCRLQYVAVELQQSHSKLWATQLKLNLWNSLCRFGVNRG